ncbi:hypothetical protein ACSBR2_029695 [Camellia fascicularis]
MKRCVEFMKSNLPYIFMILSNLVFAGTVLFSKVAIANGMNPYVFGAYRQAFATLALAPFAFFLERKNSAPLSFNLLCKIFLAAMSGITLCINLFNLSLNYIPATFVTATANAIPAITFVLAILLSCIQTLLWAVAVDRNISAWKLGWDINLLAVAYCGIMFNGVSYWMRIWVIQRRGPVFAAAFTPVSFICTAIFSVLIWKEILHWGSVGGFIILVCGLYGVLWGKHKEGKIKPSIEQKSETKEETV